MKILITICARGGSKGLPGKNIKHLFGTPLLNYSLSCAYKFAEQFDTDIIISTDDEKILEVARQTGYNDSYLRPAELATDASGKLDAIIHAKEYMEQNKKVTYDYVLDLDVSSPLRTLEDLNSAFDMLQSDKAALNIFSVSNASKNPYFNMVERKESGYFGLVKQLSGDVLSRQKAPLVYEMNASFYIYRSTFFNEGYRSALTQKSLIYLIDHECFDIDHLIDFEFMEFLLSNNKLPFMQL